MTFHPITVYQGRQVLFRQFADGMVVMPLKNTEREAVAQALREILSMVDGEITLPSFSMESCSDCLPQTETDHGDQMCGVVERLPVRLVRRSESSSFELLDQPQNDL